MGNNWKNISIILSIVGCCAFWIYGIVALILAFEFGMAEILLDNIWVAFVTGGISFGCFTFYRLVLNEPYY